MFTAYYVVACITIISIASPTWASMGVSEQAKMWGATVSALMGASLLVLAVIQ